MLNWLKKASIKAQRNNVRRTLSLLLDEARKADDKLQRSGEVPPDQEQKVVKLQRALLKDLVGPLDLQELREEFLHPIENDPDVGEGPTIAVRHVFDTASKR